MIDWCRPVFRRLQGRKCYAILYEIEAFQSNWYSNLYEISRIEAYEMDLDFCVVVPLA